MIRADVDHGPGWEEAGGSRASPARRPAGSRCSPDLHLREHRTAQGARLTPPQILAGGWNSAIAHELSGETAALCVLPLYHINAETVTLMPTLLTGGSVVMPHRFLVRCFWEWIAEYRCTWSALVPTIISQLLDWVDPRAEGMERRWSESGSCAPPRHRWPRPCTGPSRRSSGSCSSRPWVRPSAVGTSSPTHCRRQRQDRHAGPPYGFEARIVGPEGRTVPRRAGGNLSSAARAS